MPNVQGTRLLAIQYQLERSQWLSPEALLQHQLAQLKEVLDHACATVPYYRELFSANGLTVPPELDLAFLRKVPISRRAAIRDAGDALRSERVPAEHGRTRPVVTSGSTGEPVRLLGTEMTNFFWHAFALRDHLWHGRDFTRKLGAIRWAEKDSFKAPEGERWQGWGSIVDPVFESGPACMLNVATPLREQVAWLLREQPDYLLSYPSNLDALARHCIDEGIALRFIEVRTVGETLNAEQRALYEHAWVCKVVDIYTSEEAGYLALQCPSAPQFHVQSENVILEVVDEQGAPCATGEIGRVLITTLHNFATPLVRYELGDYASFGEPCGCNRGLPTITQIHGRKRNRIIYPDGRSEFPYLGEHGQIYNLTGVRVRAFQIVQRNIEDIEVRLVAEREFNAGETEKIAGRFQSNLGHPFRITITYWSEIPKGSRGKFEEFVSQVEA
jgi:phenylacetate-CoA ligase